MTPPRLTVIVPTYNQAGYLREALDTLLVQTYRDFETVVRDDASTDETEKMMAAPRTGLAWRHKGLGYFRNPENLGPATNWTRGLMSAASEYVALCCHDDLYAPDFLARAVAMLDAYPSMSFVHTAYRIIEPDGTYKGAYFASSRDAVWPGGQVFERYLTHSHNVLLSSAVMRREHALGALPLPDMFCADFWLWLWLAQRGDVGYLASPLVTYRQHGAGISGSMQPWRWVQENLSLAMHAAWDAGMQDRLEAVWQATARVWVRRMVRQAIAASAHGQRDLARESLAVASSLSLLPVGALAPVLCTRLGSLALRGVRGIRRAVA